MPIYQTAYRKNLRRNAMIVCLFIAGIVLAACMRGYSDLIPMAIFPLAVFAFVRVGILGKLVKDRRRFKAHGNAVGNEKSFDIEFGSENRFSCGHLHFTANWLFCDKPSNTFLVPIAEVVWVYKSTENKTDSYLVICFKNGGKVEISMRNDEIEAVLQLAAARYQHIVIGYSKDLAAAVGDNDKDVFRKKQADSPRVFADTGSPFSDPYYQTIVYIRREGKKHKCLLALTREERLVLLCGETIVFDRAARDIDSVSSWWFGRMTVRFRHSDGAGHTVKTYNVWRWRSLLRKARQGASPSGCEKYAYSDVDSYNFVVSQYWFYVQFAAAFVSLVFFGMMHFNLWVKKESLWNDGVWMGISAYFLVPLVFPSIFIYGYVWLNGMYKTRLFPNREDGE